MHNVRHCKLGAIGVVWCLFFILPVPFLAAEPVILTNLRQSYPIGQHLAILEDPQKQWTIAEVSSPDFSKRFVASMDAVPNFGFTPSAYWVRFQVKRDAAAITQWLLELGTAGMNTITIYLAPTACQPFQPNGEGDCRLFTIQAGDQLPFSKRDVRHRYFIFRLPIAPEVLYTVYLRFQNEDTMTLPLTLWSADAYLVKLQHEQFPLGIFYGVLLIMAGYNLFLYLSLRDRTFGHYVLFILAYFFFQAANDGLGVQYLWPNVTWFNRFAVPLFGILSLGTALLFTDAFLGVKHMLPRWHRLIVTLQIVSGLLIALLPVLGARRVLIPLTLLAILTIPILLTLGIISWRRQYQPARYFLLGWTVFLFAMFARMLANLTILPNNLLTTQSDRIGAILMILLLSLALANRIRTITQEQKRIQSETIQLKEELNTALQHSKEALEARVAAQTHDLARAKTEILVLNQVMESAEQVGTASEGLTRISSQIAAEAELTAKQVAQVSAHSREITANVQEVSTATEKVTAYIQALTGQIALVMQRITHAVASANRANTTITGLDAHSQEIDQIIKVITAIAQQTNLLALNATIEAARAGDLGRGFTVVAQEVKDLSRETSHSAEDITRLIEIIQASSREVAGAITEVAQNMEQVERLTTGIATTTTEQAGVTSQITRKVEHTAQKSQEISGAIAEIEQIIHESSERATTVETEAQELSALAAQLRHLVEQVKANRQGEE